MQERIFWQLLLINHFHSLSLLHFFRENHFYIRGQSVLMSEYMVLSMFYTKVLLYSNGSSCVSPLQAVLDGIAKGLDLRFDITEIAKL